ncbi:MAG: sulfotransferase domain-containing protein [Gemmatimonadota bacterium]
MSTDGVGRPGGPGRPGREIASRALGVGVRGLRRASERLAAAGQRLNLRVYARQVYRPRPDDIFVVTYPRSGTTWLQMLLYQLTTDGDLDFPHISDPVPWFERLSVSGRDIEAMPSPRVFKSHLAVGEVPHGPCRYIYSARDPADVAVSYFHFHRSHLGFTGDFDEFFELFLAGKVENGAWADHVAGWWERRNEPGVLFFSYEDARAEPERYLDIIARFCGIPVPAGARARILERSSLEFMKARESLFDPLYEALWELGVAPGGSPRPGAEIEPGALNREQASRMDEALRRSVGLTRSELRAMAGGRADGAGLPSSSRSRKVRVAPIESGGA